MEHALRLVDAGLNRAREAARALEDVARFGLNRADLSVRAKSLRHAIMQAGLQIEPDSARLLSWRDTEGDVGTEIKASGEMTRTGSGGLVRANAARLSEALRSLEEAAKVLSRPHAAHCLERIRYDSYTLERDLILSIGAGEPRQWRLCVLITERLCRLNWKEVARLAIEGGADCLQLREKELEGGECLRRAVYLVGLAHPRSVAIIVNDRPDIAVIAGADGVHLGQGDLGVADARRVAGSLIIGVSTESLTQARAAAEAGADYIGLGPMFSTTTKAKDRVAGPEHVHAVSADPVLYTLPHLAIGGITPQNVGLLRGTGCRGIAVSSGVCSSPDPAESCRALLAGLSPPANSA